MWWAGGRVLEAYVGTRAAALCDGAEVLLAEPADGFEDSVSRVQARLAKSGGKPRLRVWLSGGLCRPFLLPDLRGVSGHRELLQVASRLANERTGLQGQCTTWLDVPQRGRPRVAVAVTRQTVERLRSSLGGRWRLDSIAPWWSEVLRFALGHGAGSLAVGVQDCDSLTVVGGRGGGFEFATTVSPVFDRVSADSAFARAMMTVDAELRREALCRFVFPPAAGPEHSGVALASLLEVRQ